MAGLLVLYEVEGVCKTTGLTAEETAVLAEHNKLRQKHQNTPDLCYAESGDDVTYTSQAWAEGIATSGDFEHSKGEYGENIAYKSSSGDLPDKTAAYTTSTNKWYDEIKDWNFKTNKGCDGKVTGHFTQLIWKESVQLNCGHSTAEDGDMSKYYVVCQYFAKGNFGGAEDYEASVGDPVEGYVVEGTCSGAAGMSAYKVFTLIITALICRLL